MSILQPFTNLIVRPHRSCLINSAEELIEMLSTFCSIPEAIEEIKAGRILIVIDDENRENEGDFMVAAERVTPEIINFMARYGRGLICLPTTKQRLEELEIPMMVDGKTSLEDTPFTVSVDAANGVSSGVSALDRAATARLFCNPNTIPEDFERPGHLFPLRARDGGLLERDGHTEATIDLLRLAGLYPAGVLCEVLDKDGSMARLPRLIEIAEEHHLKIAAIKNVIEYLHNEELVLEFACSGG